MDVNHIIKGYQIIKILGKGGFGIVYLVQKENKYFALKKISNITKEKLIHYQELLDKLYQIKSEFVIKYYELFVENSCIYFCNGIWR